MLEWSEEWKSLTLSLYTYDAVRMLSAFNELWVRRSTKGRSEHGPAVSFRPIAAPGLCDFFQSLWGTAYWDNALAGATA